MEEQQSAESAEPGVKEIEHTSDYSYYRFNCAHGDWSGPWWSDWESAGRDGVHHYGVAHPLTELTTPPGVE